MVRTSSVMHGPSGGDVSEYLLTGDGRDLAADDVVHARRDLVGDKPPIYLANLFTWRVVRGPRTSTPGKSAAVTRQQAASIGARKIDPMEPSFPRPRLVLLRAL